MTAADIDVILRQIGAKIAYYRKIRGITQERLATMLSVSRSTISRIERGDYNLSVTMLFQIASVLEISLTTILRFDEADLISWMDKKTQVSPVMYYPRKDGEK